MGRRAERDFFDTARAAVSGGLFLAGALAIIASLLDWVRFTLDPGITSVNRDASPPISGLDVGHDGTVVLIAGLVILACAFLLVLRGRAGYAGLALVASIVIGAIAISDYKGVADLAPNVRVGQPGVGLGLVLAVAAGLLGVLAAVAGIAATPRRTNETG